MTLAKLTLKKTNFAVACLIGLSASTSQGDDAHVVHFTIDATKDVHTISPYIYGVNSPLDGPYAHCSFTRVGGNRLTVYNWVNNASNAGSDWQFQNDNIMGGGEVPGGAIAPRIEDAIAHKAAVLLTIPMTGYVAADKKGGGDVRHSGADYLKTRFRTSAARKSAPFTLAPATDSPVIYQDEFVNWVKFKYAKSSAGAAVFYSLDNEPDLWPSTHAEVHPAPPTYAELVKRTTEYALAIKAVSPSALVFGPVNYGWQGYTTLQNAPDANGRDFQSFYLAQMKSAEMKAGKRVVDVFDVHWYPEATGGGVRITGTDVHAEVVAARVQAPRSLWDNTYTETSWITQWSTKGPIELLPRLRRKIDANYPGTKLAMTEYNFGGGDHISGAIAQADVLGIFGREGVFAANEWPMAKDESFIGAAFEMCRNFDGKGGTLFANSVSAQTDDIAASSIYATAATDARGMTLLAINKTDHALRAVFEIAHGGVYRTAEVFQLTSTKAAPLRAAPFDISDHVRFFYEMPPFSVSIIRLQDKS